MKLSALNILVLLPIFNQVRGVSYAEAINHLTSPSSDESWYDHGVSITSSQSHNEVDETKDVSEPKFIASPTGKRKGPRKIINIASGIDAVGKCPYGTRFKVKCNTCVCFPETGVTRCTLKGCEPESTLACKFGKTFTVDCKTCTCNEKTNVTICTGKECNKGTFGNCVYGTVYKKGCNTCHCSVKTGITKCTDKNCSPVLGSNAKCKPGTYHKSADGCNTCYCVPESRMWLCTLMDCMPHKYIPVLMNENKGRCLKGKKYSEEYGKGECRSCICDPKTGKTNCHDIECVMVTHHNYDSSLISNKNGLRQKVKEATTGCKPPQVIIIGSCRCDCRFPSVSICYPECFSDDAKRHVSNRLSALGLSLGHGKLLPKTKN